MHWFIDQTSHSKQARRRLACGSWPQKFLVEGLLEQCRQGLQGRPALEESYMDLLEEMVLAHPPKKEPHIRMAHTMRPTASGDGKSSAAVVG